MSDTSDRLRATAAAFEALRERVVAAEPWPLSAAYGEEPESSWGPREVLAHVAEMLAYWPDQFDLVLAGSPEAPVPFGRVAADEARIARVGADRHLPAAELFDRIAAAAADAARRFENLDEGQRARVGLHPRRGEMTLDQMADRFLVEHLGEHVTQLEAILADRT